MTKARLLLLITKRLNGTLNQGETSELDFWAKESHDNREWLERMSNEEILTKEIQQWENIDPVKGYSGWRHYMQARRKARIRQIAGWSLAASILIAVTVIGLIRRGDRGHIPTPPAATVAITVLPGKNTATLTLGNGQKVLLDSVGSGELGKQGNTRLVKLDNGSLSYSVGNGKEGMVAYNTLTTPRSGQYQVMLADGSHIWLNNMSSLRYPTSFRGKDRTVELTGEAYFEIAKDQTKPFNVIVGGEEVEVLGTSFNIMAYSDEGTTETTLLTGAVKVRTDNYTVRLRPDEQAQWSKAGEPRVVKNVPSQDIISWKNGFFYFGHASLQEVMRQLARWYDIDVRYEGAIPDVEFGGKIDRSLPLNELLKFLDKNQVHFRLEGRSIVVLPS